MLIRNLVIHTATRGPIPVTPGIVYTVGFYDPRYMTRRNICCRSSNVIYFVHCSSCNKDYFGQTKHRLVEHLREHFRNVRQNCNNHIIGRHYNSAGHVRIPDMIISVLEFIRAPSDSQTAKQLKGEKETKSKYRLRSVILTGFNLMD